MNRGPTSLRDRQLLGAAAGLAAAALFGFSAPASKRLLPSTDPWMLAALLYCGAGLGMAIIRAVRPRHRAAGTTPPSDHLQRADLPLLAAIAVLGGGFGPVLMLVGLTHISGVAGSLLLNLEAVFTMLIAGLVFGERLNGWEAVGAIIVVAGALALSYAAGATDVEPVGVVATAAACLAWGVDNNLTARLSVRNPVQIVEVKALAAGIGNLVLSLAAGRSLPAPSIIGVILALGFASYGLSIMLDVYALRYVGASREAAYFATAPFAGALAAIPLLGETPSLHEMVGGLLMAAGIVVLVRAGTRRR
jgi:drug/metabolite transporter (DMT)-like permease